MNWIDKPIVRTKRPRPGAKRRKISRGKDGRFLRKAVRVAREPVAPIIPPALVIDDHGNLSGAIGCQ